MAKFDFNKPVASFSWYLQNGSADDKRGNRLHVGTGQKAQIYFDPESGEFIGKLKYVDDYIDLADGAKQHFELPRTAREYKPSDFSPKFPISNVKFEVDESVKDFIHVLPRGLFFYQNEFYDAVFGDNLEAELVQELREGPEVLSLECRYARFRCRGCDSGYDFCRFSSQLIFWSSRG